MNKDLNMGSKTWPLIGNLQVSGFLEKSIASGNVVGSYVFFGSEGLGKATTARFFAKSLLCSSWDSAPCGVCSSCRQFRDANEIGEATGIAHPDYFSVGLQEDKKNISVEQIREFIRNLNLSPFLNSYKVGIIKNSESLSSEAANALLKTLEEPKKKAVAILLTSDLSSMPSTIISRSQVLNFYPVSGDLIYDHLANDLRIARGEAKNIARLAAGRPALALKFLQDNDFLRNHLEKAEIFLDLFPLDINGRAEKIKKFCEDGSVQNIVAKDSLALFDIWRSVLRDMLLLFSGNRDIVRYEIFKDKIEKSLKYVSARRIFSLDKSLRLATEKLGANVSCRLVLENFIYNM